LLLRRGLRQEHGYLAVHVAAKFQLHRPESEQHIACTHEEPLLEVSHTRTIQYDKV